MFEKWMSGSTQSPHLCTDRWFSVWQLCPQGHLVQYLEAILAGTSVVLGRGGGVREDDWCPEAKDMCCKQPLVQRADSTQRILQPQMPIVLRWRNPDMGEGQ